MKICILGPAHPLRGGIASFNERLALQFQNEGHQVDVITFSLQYPNLLFPGKTQFSDAKAPENIHIEVLVNSINPLNWIKTAIKINAKNYDFLIVRYWTPFLAPCLGTIAKLVKNKNKTKVICLVDNIIPHEKHFFDSILTRYFIRGIDGYVTMSQSVLEDLKSFHVKVPITLTPHPMFDNFGEKVTREEALQTLDLSPDYRYFLYFGLIRSYKGLDLLLDAFADEKIKKYPVKLIVAGEFYEDSTPYFAQIEKHNLSENLVLKTEFIPNDLVAHYFCAADLVILPYKNATQSGVTQIAYHFSKPMLVTNVGGLPEIVPDGKCGYAVKPQVDDIRNAILDFLENDKKSFFIEGLESEKERFQWDKMSNTFYQIFEKL